MRAQQKGTLAHVQPASANHSGSDDGNFEDDFDVNEADDMTGPFSIIHAFLDPNALCV